MATNFPSSLDSFTNPSGTDAMDSVTVPHATQHADLNDAVEALEAKVGVDGSAVTSSLDYKVANQGLTLVKTQTVGSGVSSVTVTGITGFVNYLFMFDRVDPSSNSLLFIDSPDLTSATGWKSTTLLWQGVATPTVYNLTGNTECYCGLLDTNGSALRLTVWNPNNTGRTRFNSEGMYSTYPFISGGQYDLDTTADSFTFRPSTGTLTGGTIRVYGFNNG